MEECQGGEQSDQNNIFHTNQLKRERVALLYHLETSETMNPTRCKRFVLTGPPGTRTISIGSENEKASTFSQSTSVRDEAALLLSIADIAKSEIRGGSTLWDDVDEGLPKFPLLSSDRTSHTKWFTPRAESLSMLLASGATSKLESEDNTRIRAVSIDAPVNTSMRTASPLGPAPNLVSPMHSPTNRRLPVRHKSLRLSKQAKRECIEKPYSMVEKKGKALQGTPPKAVPTRKIGRKKFSWKNYPELEQFLVANREEYLRHSALNYTVQQKQYNNRLTEQLLEIATEHGYMFDEKEFSFVTVRDRIRCYYKSYVQSAKKRGTLLGYAARKAGLLDEEELEKSAETSRIILPA